MSAPFLGVPPRVGAERRHLLRLAAPAAVFLLALGVRLLFVCGYHSPADYVFSDMRVYEHGAQNLLSGTLSAWDTFTPVGYPALVAVVYWLGGDAFVVGVLQALLGALTVLIAWWLAARSYAHPAAALAVGLVCAVHVPAVFYTGFLLTETLFSFLVMAGTWVLMKGFDRSSRWGFVLCGLILGYAATVRPNVLVFLPAVPLVARLALGRWKDAAAASLWLAAAFAVPVATVAAHNARLVGVPTLATNGGLNFYLNFAAVRGVLYRDERGVHGITPIPNLYWYPGGDYEETVTVPFYADAHYFRRGVELLRERPARVAVTARNLVESSGIGRQGYWPGDGRVIQTHRRAFFFLGVLPGLAGVVLLGFRRRYARAENLPLVVCAGLVLSTLITLMFFLGDPRIRVPFDPFLILLAAAGYLWIGRAMRAAWRRHASKGLST